MCYVCNCFAWTLDLFQRALTFCLSCWLVFAACCGLFIAVIAGIAYGYNYCVAEFITLTRADVKVYMRRGQFYDKPDLQHPKRRMGDDEDAFPFNLSDDYKQEVQSNDEAALSDKWVQDEDTRKYAEKLTKYSERPKVLIEENEQAVRAKEPYHMLTPSPQHLLLMTYPTVSTTIWQSGSSEIIMRMFDPVPRPVITEPDKYEHGDTKVHKALGDVLAKPKTIEQDDVEVIDESLGIRLRQDDTPKSELMKMRNWKPPSNTKNFEYSPDVDDDIIIYKSV